MKIDPLNIEVDIKSCVNQIVNQLIGNTVITLSVQEDLDEIVHGQLIYIYCRVTDQKGNPKPNYLCQVKGNYITSPWTVFTDQNGLAVIQYTVPRGGTNIIQVENSSLMFTVKFKEISSGSAHYATTDGDLVRIKLFPRTKNTAGHRYSLGYIPEAYRPPTEVVAYMWPISSATGNPYMVGYLGTSGELVVYITGDGTNHWNDPLECRGLMEYHIEY